MRVLRKARKLQERTLGEEHEDTLDSINHLGRVLRTVWRAVDGGVCGGEGGGGKVLLIGVRLSSLRPFGSFSAPQCDEVTPKHTPAGRLSVLDGRSDREPPNFSARCRSRGRRPANPILPCVARSASW